MKRHLITTTSLLVLTLAGGSALAQQPAAVERVSGVKQENVESVKKVEPAPVIGGAQAVQGVPQNNVQSVKKVEQGTVTGTAEPIPPPPVMPVAPPPPPAVQQVQGVPQNAVESVKKVETGTVTGTAQPVPPAPVQPVVGTTTPAGGTVIGGCQIHAVQGVGGINTAKLQNLAAALRAKDSEAEGRPNGRGAASQLGPPGPTGKPTTEVDGRAGFQEFQKLQTNGS